MQPLPLKCDGFETAACAMTLVGVTLRASDGSPVLAKGLSLFVEAGGAALVALSGEVCARLKVATLAVGGGGTQVLPRTRAPPIP